MRDERSPEDSALGNKLGGLSIIWVKQLGIRQGKTLIATIILSKSGLDNPYVDETIATENI